MDEQDFTRLSNVRPPFITTVHTLVKQITGYFPLSLDCIRMVKQLREKPVLSGSVAEESSQEKR